MKVQTRHSLLLATALVALTQIAPARADGAQTQEPREFAEAMALVFPEYPPGSPQREAISHDARTESGYRRCSFSRTHDEGVFQLHGSRRFGMHLATGVPIALVVHGKEVPPHTCVSMLDQVRYARQEWKLTPACAAFERARTEREAYRIFRGVYGRGLSLAAVVGGARFR